MIKVSSRNEAWGLAIRLFPTDYTADMERSSKAGYPIYFTTEKGVNAWISDLGDRLQLNYPNGSTESIWVEEKNDVVTTIGCIKEKKVFPSVTIQEVEERKFVNLLGLTFGIEAGEPAVKFWTSEEKGSVYRCDEIAYVKIGDNNGK